MKEREWSLSAHGVFKSFGPHSVLSDITCSFESGCIYGIVGPSGIGKTTLLRILSFLDAPSSGVVQLRAPGGEVVATTPRVGVASPKAYPLVSILLQEGGLWPHLSIHRNIRLAWRKDSSIPWSRIADWSDSLGVTPIAGKKPRACSTGQRQRAALLRLLAASPKIALLDEPVASLDASNRALVGEILADAAVNQNMGIVVVSHSEGVLDQLRAVRLRLSGAALEPTHSRCPGRSPND